MSDFARYSRQVVLREVGVNGQQLLRDSTVLVIGLDGDQLLGLQLTSKDHDRDAAQEAAAGRFWMDVGVGAWDHEHRPSEVRLNRLLRLDPRAVRREGAALPRDLFDGVVAAAMPYLP